MLEATVHYQFEAFDYCCLKQFTRHVITSLYFVKKFFTIWKVVKEVLGGAEMLHFLPDVEARDRRNIREV